ncbi:MAG: hypothetical protein KatS3mg049_0319 [Caldilinea sp.]|jgi:hypothetical protein|nr:MAG: hypothetical protein KatS3mg049_0319 [Caldilinea sp.]
MSRGGLRPHALDLQPNAHGSTVATSGCRTLRPDDVPMGDDHAAALLTQQNGVDLGVELL